MLDWQSTLNYHEMRRNGCELVLRIFGKGDDLKIKTLEQICVLRQWRLMSSIDEI